MKHNTQYEKASIRTRFTIAPDDLALSGLYKHLASLKTERMRAMALRLMLQSRNGFPPDCDVACSDLPTISVRITISERDVGLGDLHATLLNAPTDTQRRMLLKNEIKRIQANVLQSGLQSARHSEPSNELTSFDKPLTSVDSKIMEMPAKEAAASINGNEDITALSGGNDYAVAIPATKNHHLKSRMRDASRMFDA